MPRDTIAEFDDITTYWGGATFILAFMLTKRLTTSLGLMSPVIAAGMAYSQINRMYHH